MKWILPVVGFLGIFASLAFWNAEPDPFNLPRQVDFNFHIRPILSNNCFTCHGPDSSSREAGLRLDQFESAIATLESGGAAIVPGKAHKSLLLERIHSQNPSEVMPPPEAKKELSEREKALLEKWIDQGAQWKDYWAFIPPKAPTLPRKVKAEGASGVIDYLVDKELKYKSLIPSSKANKSSLIRRVSFLLTGLPPKEDELDRYFADTTARAYERLVDRYLASPHYGERWARHWMDLVRYGESMGHEFDYNIGNAWEYRDYLIRAFNQDIPYNLFVKEHLAGDMLPSPRRNPTEGFNESILGTGYFYLGEGKHSPVDTKQEESDRIDNMIDVTSKTFMGLTVSCARCHDHKFDPIPATDYYAMYGMLESARVGPIAARQTLEQKHFLQQLDSLKGEIKQHLMDAIQESKQSEPVGNVIPVRLEEPTSTAKKAHGTPNREKGKVLADFREGKWEGWTVDGLAFGTQPIQEEPIIEGGKVWVERSSPAYASSRFYGKGIQGTLRGPNFIIDTDSIIVRARGHHGSIRVIIDNFQLIQNPLWGGLQAEVNDSVWTTYKLHMKLAQGHKAYLQFMSGSYGKKAAHVYSIEPEDYIEVAYAVAYDSTYEAFVEPKANPQRVEPLLKEPKLEALVGAHEEIASKLYDPTHFLGFQEGESIFSPVFLRGSINSLSEEKVEHRFFDTLSHLNDSFPQEGSGRLAWAEAVVDPQNPLGTRVYVNRLWHHLFGRGIVETVDNFGLQGKMPSHPDLLDYLTLTFQQEGWSTKNMLRHILLSETFQRSTQSLEENLTTDPNNIYLHHFPIRRLEAEAIRDGMLATAGCIDLNMYGPSVPIHLTAFLKGRGRPPAAGPLDGMGRRSIYMSVRRNFMAHMMSVFDQPMPFTTFGKRNTTNVPAQSLTLMNDPFVKEQATFWAQNLMKESGLTPEQRIQHIYGKAFSRGATEEEVEKGIEFLKQQAELLGGEFDTNPEDVQVWATYCHALFNLKEFIHLL